MEKFVIAQVRKDDTKIWDYDNTELHSLKDFASFMIDHVYGYESGSRDHLFRHQGKLYEAYTSHRDWEVYQTNPDYYEEHGVPFKPEPEDKILIDTENPQTEYKMFGLHYITIPVPIDPDEFLEEYQAHKDEVNKPLSYIEQLIAENKKQIDALIAENKMLRYNIQELWSSVKGVKLELHPPRNQEISPDSRSGWDQQFPSYGSGALVFPTD